MIETFLNTYGITILYAIVTAIGGYVALAVKALYTKFINDKTKQDVAKTCVKAVEQIYKDLHGDEKLAKAMTAASEMLTSKGIRVSDLELRMLLEAAVAEFNKAFEKKK